MSPLTATCPSSTRRRAALGTVASIMLVAIVLGGCGDDESKASSGKDSTDSSVVEKQGSARTTTTEAPEATTTSEFAVEGTETTVAPDGAIPTPPVIDPSAVVPAAQDSAESGWNAELATLRGQNGLTVRYTCEPNGQLSAVWGSNPYTDDSSVCSAAVHSGLFTVESGGSVVIRIAPGEPTYLGTVAFAVTSSDYGSWDGSFLVLGRG